MNVRIFPTKSKLPSKRNLSFFPPFFLLLILFSVRLSDFIYACARECLHACFGACVSE